MDSTNVVASAAQLYWCVLLKVLALYQRLSEEQKCLLSLFIQSKDQMIQNKVQELQIKELEFKLKTKELEDKLVS
jgi:hypothetical protein